MAENVLSVKNLSAGYGEKPVLNDVSFEIKPGEFVCLCGPNGSGKSTLLSVVAGLFGGISFPVDAVKVGRRAINQLKRKEIAKEIAFMQQSEYSEWNFTVYEFVLQGRFAYSKNGHYSKEDTEIVNKVLSDLGLLDFSERNIHLLSGGEFQKIRIARVLAQKPNFLLLDEPAANLDYVYEPKLLSLLRDQTHANNIRTLVSIHDINLANRFADKILLLPVQKPVICGEPSVIMNVENLQKTFGAEFECRKTESFQLLQ